MLLHVASVLDANEVAHLRARLAQARWADGRVTAGSQSAHAKDNGQLAETDPAVMRRTLVGFIRRYRPSVVVSFDPNGVNLHVDHVAIARFTMDAVSAAADARIEPSVGAPHDVTRVLWTPLLTPWESAAASDLAAEGATDFVIDVSRWKDARAAALRAHRTQHQSVDRYFFNRPDLDRILGVEIYRQAWGPPLRRRPAPNVWD